MRSLRTHTAVWFAATVVVFVVGLVLLPHTGGDVLVTVGGIAFVVVCLRAVVLSIRDDDVSSSTIRSPAERTLAMGGTTSRAARRRRRLEDERRRAAED